MENITKNSAGKHTASALENLIGKGPVISDQVEIQSNLIGREEAFRMIALAETVGVPLLFIGIPGIAKTKCVREYASARVASGAKLFILETDEHTRPSAVKGRPNMAALVDKEHPRYEVISPIATADYIVINEIDKASNGMRNAFLSILQEKMLFNGQEEVPLRYRAFIATCNEVPREEKDSPFWDRFILKVHLNRLSVEQLMSYYRQDSKKALSKFSFSIPSARELLQAGKIPDMKLSKLLNVCYAQCSDRTLCQVPNIVRAVTAIWKCSIDKALIKTAEILAGVTASKMLADQILSKEIKSIMDKVDLLHGLKDAKALEDMIEEIRQLVDKHAQDGKLQKSAIAEIEEAVNMACAGKPLHQQLFSDVKAA